MRTTTDEAEQVCKANGTYMFAHDSDCRAYYLCENGQVSSERCAKGQLFNMEVMECEEESGVFCDTRSRPTTATARPTQPANKCKWGG